MPNLNLKIMLSHSDVTHGFLQVKESTSQRTLSLVDRNEDCILLEVPTKPSTCLNSLPSSSRDS